VAEKLGRFGRFFDALNTPIAVLVVLVVVVSVNVPLYLDYHSSETSAPTPTERSSGLQRTVETTEQPAAPKEPTRPATTLQSTVPAEQSATPSATASATSSPSP